MQKCVPKYNTIVRSSLLERNNNNTRTARLENENVRYPKEKVNTYTYRNEDEVRKNTSLNEYCGTNTTVVAIVVRKSRTRLPIVNAR